MSGFGIQKDAQLVMIEDLVVGLVNTVIAEGGTGFTEKIDSSVEQLLAIIKIAMEVADATTQIVWTEESERAKARHPLDYRNT